MRIFSKAEEAPQWLLIEIPKTASTSLATHLSNLSDPWPNKPDEVGVIYTWYNDCVRCCNKNEQKGIYEDNQFFFRRHMGVTMMLGSMDNYGIPENVTVIRNPFSWYASLYKSAIDVSKPDQNWGGQKLLDQKPSFEKWLEGGPMREIPYVTIPLYKKHYELLDWLRIPGDSTIMCENFIYFENLEESWHKFLREKVYGLQDHLGPDGSIVPPKRNERLEKALKNLPLKKTNITNTGDDLSYRKLYTPKARKIVEREQKETLEYFNYDF